MVADLMLFVRVVVCASLGGVVLKDLVRLLNMAKPGGKRRQGTLLSQCREQLRGLCVAPRARRAEEARKAECSRRAAALATLRDGQLKSRQGRAAAAEEALVEACAMSKLLRSADGKEMRRLLFTTAEEALQAVDWSGGRARRLAAELLDSLRSSEGAVAEWQLHRLQDAYRTELEVHALMIKANKAHYENSAFRRAEKAGDHRLADVETLLGAEYDAMHEVELLLGE